MRDTTWRKKITRALEAAGETWSDVEGWQAWPPRSTMPDQWLAALLAQDDSWLDVPFNDGHGVPEGCSFRLWTVNRVYFSFEYDGAEGVRSVQRHPASPLMPPQSAWSPSDTRHIGG